MFRSKSKFGSLCRNCKPMSNEHYDEIRSKIIVINVNSKILNAYLQIYRVKNSIESLLWHGNGVRKLVGPVLVRDGGSW